MIEMNQYQTLITEDLLKDIPLEVLDLLFDILNNVEFVKRLVSPSREFAKDRPRDDKGRIIVDLANPHILLDMDYFRPTALHYKKYGTFTNLKPNANPNSEYGKWIREEKRRCWEGYIRLSDGEWIPGLLYFYMNYCPIILSKIRKGTKQADRIIDFPEMWEGIYWRFHYMDLARSGGLYNDFMGGNHGAELASRGKAFAYSQYVETPQGRKRWADINIGDSLFAPDGTITKVINIPFNGEYDVYKMTLIDGRVIFTTLEHLWKINKNGESWNKLYSTKEILDSKNIKRFAIEVSKGVDYEYKEPPIHPYLLGLMLGDGSFTISKYNQAQFTSREEDVLVYSDLLHIPFKRVGNTKMQWLIDYPEFGKKAKELNLHNKISDTKFIPDCYKYNSREIRKQVLLGLFDTDGTVHDSGKPELCTTSKLLAEDVCWVARSLGYNASYWIKHPKYTYKGEQKIGKTCYVVYVYTNDCLFNLPRKIKLCGRRNAKLDSRVHKTSIKSIEYSHKEKCKCVTVDREDGLFLIGDFITTHNSKSYSMASILTHNFVLGENETACESITSLATAYLKEYLTKDGVLNKFVSMANFCALNTQFPRRRLKNSLLDMTWTMGYKDAELDIEKGTLNSVLGVSSKDDESKLRGKRAAFIGVEEFGTFPRLIDLYNVMLPSVLEGDYVFGLMYLQGTAGDNESDFAGAQEIMYNPRGYNMYALPNVFDKNNQGKKDFVFFFPGYINRKGCYNEDGVSDVIKALLEILMNRYRVKYNSTDSNTIIKTIAEVPITPAEAIVKTGVNMFPVTDLSERLSQLDSNPAEWDDVYTGELVIKDGAVEFNPSSKNPIREFPHKDNKIEGAVEIFLMPEIDKRTGKPYSSRYILGADPYDNDEANTMSLGSIFVLDLWTDKIVAEYTGRPMYADDYFEICRRLCIFYNGQLNYELNKKGLFSHFSKMNCLHYLTDVLDFLKEKNMAKPGYGNTAKGTTATAPVNAFAKNLLRSWLLKPITTVAEIDGEQQEIEVYNLYSLRSRALIKELISYNPLGNFDRISAMGMLMLLREDKLILYNGDVSREKSEKNNSSYLGNDPFFKKNYDDRLSKFSKKSLL